MGPTPERRRAQFELERTLRQRILTAAPQDRSAAAASVYQELLEKFPDHRRLHFTDEYRRQIGARGAAMIGPLAPPHARILEVGCGRGDTLLELARLGHTCIGIEPSRHMLELFEGHPLVTLLAGTAEKLDFPDASFDLVFSQQTLEHLHPDDVPLHLAEARRILKPGGTVAIETPNRVSGPQDCSRGFVKVAQGLHLKEWTCAELARELRRADFSRIQGHILPPVIVRRSARLHRFARVPAALKVIEESMLAVVPGMGFRTRLGRALGVDDVFLFAEKPAVDGNAEDS